jgi:hypothetical protein
LLFWRARALAPDIFKEAFKEKKEIFTGVGEQGPKFA